MMIAILAALAATGCCAAEQPQLTGAKLVERSAKAGVQAAIQEIIKADKGPAWIAYSAPVSRASDTCAATVRHELQAMWHAAGRAVWTVAITMFPSAIKSAAAKQR
jgi:hypothetical protein